MELKKITLSVCNQDVVVTINAEKEEEFRKIAKNINDEFSKSKERFLDVEDARLMAYLLLQTRFTAAQKPSKPSI